MDVREAVEVALGLKPRVVIPMHYLKADPQEFKRRLAAKSNIKVLPLDISEVFQIR